MDQEISDSAAAAYYGGLGGSSSKDLTYPQAVPMSGHSDEASTFIEGLTSRTRDFNRETVAGS